MGKTIVVKVLQSSRELLELGNTTAALANVIQESTISAAACYEHVEAMTMTDVRFKEWNLKTANSNIVSVPKLMSLPRMLAWHPLVLVSTMSGGTKSIETLH